MLFFTFEKKISLLLASIYVVECVVVQSRENSMPRVVFAVIDNSATSASQRAKRQIMTLGHRAS
jgi:hypothetical protein